MALLLGVTLALSSCGNQAADAAAIVDGTVIGDKEVQTASRQLTKFAPGQADQYTPSNVMLGLILAPYVSAEAIRAGKSVPDSEVLKFIAKVDEPSLATADFARMLLALQKLDQQSQTRIVGELGKAKITVNPRYGTFDPKLFALSPNSPNWIKAGATAEPK